MIICNYVIRIVQAVATDNDAGSDGALIYFIDAG